MKAYTKDIIKTITKGKKRFFAILLIAALGVCMLTGIKAGCDDLRVSADEFFDKQNLMDIMIASTLGLTDEDIEVLTKLDGVEAVEGGYSETVFTSLEGKTKQASMQVLSQKGINLPYLLEGNMPTKADEILVTQKYIDEAGKTLGDIVQIEEDFDEEESEEETEEEESSEDDDLEIEIEEEEETPNFLQTSYKIVGVVIDPTDINSNQGAVSFRANATTDYTFFVLPDAVESDIYTVIYMTTLETDELLCYSDAYEEKVDTLVKVLEDEIKKAREDARYDSLRQEASGKVDEAESEMNDKFDEAESEIEDARQEIADAKNELADALTELNDGEKELLEGESELKEAESELKEAESELEEAQKEIEDGFKELEEGESELKEGEEQLAEKESELLNGEEELKKNEENARTQFGEAKKGYAEQLATVIAAIEPIEKGLAEAGTQVGALQAKLNAGTITPQEIKQLEELQVLIPEQQKTLEELIIQRETLKATITEVEKQEKEALTQIEESKKTIEAGKTEIEKAKKEIEKSKEQLTSVREELEKAKKEWEKGKKELEEGWADLEEGKKDIKEAKQELKDGWKKYEDGLKELAEGESELEENVTKFEDKKEEALELIADARDEIEELEMAEWYISTRLAFSGYNNIKTDAQCIESIGNAFPILFLTIAILISLTTISRMVEEDRGLIGTYKALGFKDREIQKKYVIYALLASILGGILGDFIGYVVLPQILFIVFGIMYQLPEYQIGFNLLYGIGGVILFIIGISGAAMVSCESELSHMPATLMRPKAPKNGSRVLLERIKPLWRRLSFLNKVTVRNLFRYKKRLFMTLFGIAGCTSLLIAGFTIKDTVTELMYKQYGGVYQYDAIVVAEDNDKLLEYVTDDTQVESYLNLHISNVKIINEEGKKENVQLMVLPEGSSFDGYVTHYDKQMQKIQIQDSDIYLTINATKILGIEKGESITIQTLELDTCNVELTEIVTNYLGNCVYMTQHTYEELFGEFEANAILVNMATEESQHELWTEALAEKDGILSASAAAGFEEDADTVFQIINMVVYVIIVLAAALAFVVLFTLATTNISERERELATIKVLGFFDKEVHLYVNKETIILTSIGILLGLPGGTVFGEWLMSILNMPSIYFDANLYPISYLWSALLTVVFAFIVNFITDRTLDKIDPVVALKSIE